MESWWTVLITAIAAILASSGFWGFIQWKNSKRSYTDRLLQGVAYGQILSLGMEYITRGWITDDEYHDLRHYLYEPYKALGGNGVTARVMAAVDDLPLRPRAVYAEVLQAAKTRSLDNEQFPTHPYSPDDPFAERSQLQPTQGFRTADPSGTSYPVLRSRTDLGFSVR